MLNKQIRISVNKVNVYHAIKNKGWETEQGHLLEVDDLSFTIVEKNGTFIVSDRLTGIRIHLDSDTDGFKDDNEKLLYMQTVLVYDLMQTVNLVSRDDFYKCLAEPFQTFVKQFGPSPEEF